MPAATRRRRGSAVSDEANLDAYLKRVNYAGSIAPTIETLQMLHRLHPAAIPFENLDPLMDQPVRLGLSDLEQKLVVEHRGGYCYEHNLLFKAVLEAMDFTVTPLAAGVLWGHDDPSDPQLAHMVLLVDAGGTPHLADVGFGGQVLTAPLKLRPGAEQETPNERYRLIGGDRLWRLESEIAGEWRPLYQFDLTPRTAQDYGAMNDLSMNSFKDDLIASRVDGPSRFALHNGRLRTHDAAQTTTRMLGSVAEIRDVLTNVFGIALPQTERLDPALEKALRPGASD
jgi:N-hydroxyarylamine O-acetyltransferase